ncbi:hypothetical protein GIB67_000953 [Kingdonia uniflora]|uniref:DUF7725 domain-containing protein n=1 Tax=Kingdonia uniflora TaxID=39325 RepID=A0A7J7MG02_9MAGN|nr:hypothetical protein GIB67_000953 [Kingdonia uniflora]
MEAAAGVAAGRGGSLPMPSSTFSSSQSARKEWRAISEHSVRNSTNEDLERAKLGQTMSHERTIYEDGNGSLDVDFCSIMIDGGGNNDSLDQQLLNVSRQRVDYQQIEINIRANIIARSQIMQMRNDYEVRINEEVNAADKLKAWAKDDLLREQNNELATFRRERDNSEAERCQLLKQIHDLNEHIQEKERHYAELEEQHRVAQETMQYKDEQLREIQAWGTRVQEADAQIQVEYRDRLENFSQFWHGCQRQFADMDRHIQQLQLQLAEASEKSGFYKEDSRTTPVESIDASQLGRNNGSQLSLPNDGKLNGDILPNGNVDNAALTGNGLIKVCFSLQNIKYLSNNQISFCSIYLNIDTLYLEQTENIPGFPVVPSSLLGMNAYLQPGQVAAIHPYIMHQQAHAGQFQAIPAISAHQQWQNQQVVLENTQISSQNQYLASQTEQNLLNSQPQSEYLLSSNGQVIPANNYLEAHINNPSEEANHIIISSNEDSKKIEAGDKMFLVTQEPHSNINESTKFHEVLEVDSPKQNSETKGQEENIVTVASQVQEGQGLVMEQPSLSNVSPHQVNAGEATKILEPTLLDERSLLACIVRAIGSGGGVRITSTLPNRLGKMLAPLHWHDYKRKYGKLDEFVAGHSELFIVEGDFIQLREGAQVIISATTARAKVAAAKDSGPYSSLMPSVAVTPVAQNHHLKKVPSIDSKPVKTSVVESLSTNGLSNVKILSKPKDRLESNGLLTDFKAEHSSVHSASVNGAIPDRTGVATSQHKGSSTLRHAANFGGKQQGRCLTEVSVFCRATGAVQSSRR